MDKALTLIQDLAQLKFWLYFQMILDSELLEEGKIIYGYREFGDHNTLVPYYQYINNYDDLLATLNIKIINKITEDRVQSFVTDISDVKPLTHMQVWKRINDVLRATYNR